MPSCSRDSLVLSSVDVSKLNGIKQKIATPSPNPVAISASEIPPVIASGDDNSALPNE